MASEKHYENGFNPKSELYGDAFTYLGIAADDIPSYFIKKHFKETNQFIHEAHAEGVRLLVHCNAGVSRSTTVVVAYLMKQ